MLDTDDVVHAWNRAGNPTPHHPLALSSYHDLLRDLARDGLGPDGGAR